MTTRPASLHTTANLLRYRPQLVRRGKTDLELVEAIMIAATNAIYPASFGDLRETRAGYDLFAAIHALTGTEADHDIMTEVGMFAGVVKTEDL